MDAQGKGSENAATARKLTLEERHWVRIERLKRLDDQRLRANVCDALAEQWRDGLQPGRVLVRRSFAQLKKGLPDGTFSDRRRPPPARRPPASRLISARGSALEAYLTILFVAQTTTKPGHMPKNPRPVLPRVTDRSGLRPWSELLAIRAERRPGTRRTSTSIEDNRVRQIAATLNRLASDEVRLLDLPNAHLRREKYQGFIPLDESGDLTQVSKVRYRVPKATEQVFSLPISFFTNGWHMILSDSELALLLAVLAHGAATLPHKGVLPWPPQQSVVLDGDTRIRWYGISPDTYGAHRYLDHYGLLEVEAAENRRSDGTWEGQSEGERPLPHRLRVREEGFEKDALPIVIASLKGLGARKPAP